jgi:D-arabinose 1-dehydrogenase-like Zn-dependent alcohol dehydrogenase
MLQERMRSRTIANLHLGIQFAARMGRKVAAVARGAEKEQLAKKLGAHPVVETFPMSKVNDALEHLCSGKARYRIVLTNPI